MKNLNKIDFVILGLAIVYFLVISVFQINIIPDYLGIYNHIEPQSVITTIISTITTILGLIAILFVIQFEILQRYIGNSANEIFRENRQFYLVIIWSLFSTIISFITLVQLKKEITNISITQLYFSIAIFSVSLYYILKFSRSFLEIGDINRRSFSIIDSIETKDFSDLHQLNREHILPHKKLFDDSKFGQLRKIGVSHAKNNEEIGWTLILDYLFVKTIEQQELGNNRQISSTILECLLFVVKPMCQVAFQNKNYSLINYVIRNCQYIYEKSITDKHHLENYKSLLEFIDYLILECINNNFKDSTRKLVWNISDNIQKQLLNNCPKKENIIDIFEHETLEHRLKKDASSKDSSQWRLLSMEYPNRLLKILRLALQNNDGDLVHSLTMNSSTLCKRIMKSDLEDDLKGNFVWWHLDRITKTLIDWMSRSDSKVYAENVSLLKPIEYREEIIQAKAYIPRVIETYYDYLRNLIELEDLDYFLPVYRLHGIGKIACEHFRQNIFHRRLLIFHLKYLYYFKNELEKNLKVNYRAYDALKEEFETMLKLINTIDPVPPNILSKHNQILSNFKKTKKFKIGEQIRLEKRDKS